MLSPTENDASSVKKFCLMKTVKKTSFEHAAPPNVNEYRAELVKFLFFCKT